MCDLPFYIWFLAVSGCFLWVGVLVFSILAWYAWLFSEKDEVTHVGQIGKRRLFRNLGVGKS